jgi:transcriptional regulator with XRE-family HTH domain
VVRRLDHARRLQGWTWSELAQQARVSGGTLSKLHRGVRTWETLNAGALARLCRVLNISLDWLVGPLGDDPGGLAPPGQDAWQLTQPERESYLIQLTARAELLKRLRIAETLNQLRSINDDAF